MRRRILVAGALGAAAMVGGALFPLLLTLFAPTPAGDGGVTVLAAPNLIVLASVLVVLPGPIGLYLAHGKSFGRLPTAAVGALVAGLLLTSAAAFVDFVAGSVPGNGLVRPATAGLLLVGSVGTGLATVRGNMLAHRRVGGALLAVSAVALLGTVPLLSALSLLAAVPAALVGLVATGPTGLAWLVLGYDLLTLEDLSVQPTRIVPTKD